MHDEYPREGQGPQRTCEVAGTQEAKASRIAKQPHPSTLRKYGLSLVEWEELHREQGGRCGVCGKIPPGGRLVIDHEHRPGWAKLPPEKRKLYVRGLLDNYCNYRVLRKGMTLDRLKGAVKYLEKYAEKKKG